MCFADAGTEITSLVTGWSSLRGQRAGWARGWLGAGLGLARGWARGWAERGAQLQGGAESRSPRAGLGCIGSSGPGELEQEQEPCQLGGPGPPTAQRLYRCPASWGAQVSCRRLPFLPRCSCEPELLSTEARAPLSVFLRSILVRDEGPRVPGTRDRGVRGPGMVGPGMKGPGIRGPGMRAPSLCTELGPGG